MANFWDGWFSGPSGQQILNGLPPGQQFIVSGPKGEKFAAVSTPNGVQVSSTPIVAGAVTANANPKIVVTKYDDGSMHAVTVNPADGSVSDRALTGPDAALAAKIDAQTAHYQAQTDQIKAMAAVNPALAQAHADRLNEQIANDTALTPAKIANLQASAAAKYSTVGLNAAKVVSTTALAGKYDAEAAKLQEGFLATYGPQIAVIHKAVLEGNMTPEQGQAAIDGLTQQAIEEAKTGMTAAQRATNDTNMAGHTATLAGQEVSQANSRAATASSNYNSAAQTAMSMFKGAAPGQGAIFANGLQALVNGGQDAVNSAPGAAPVQFTADHFQQLRQLLMSGKVQPDAQGNLVPNALKMLANQQPDTPDQTPTMLGPGSPGFTGGGQVPQFSAPAAA